MTSAAEDEGWMHRALAEARRGLGRTSPNPAVGAVIVRDGQLLASGHHARAGADHAEVAALRPLGFRAPGATLYCTLEPCDHVGRTGPCTSAIVDAGITRVVVGTIDPNPRVEGRGLIRLRAAGIPVEVGVLGAECAALNEAFNHAIVARQPFVVLKVAASLDGRIATRTGQSQWITSPEARALGRELRATLPAIVIGVGTALADDPLLTSRLEGRPDPLRVVLDSQLRLPLRAQLVATARETPTLVLTTRAAPARRRTALEKRGVEVAVVRATRAGRVDVRAALAAIHARELDGVLVEGGPTVHGAFLDARLAHKIVWFVAPMILGGPRVAHGGRGVAKLAQALRFEALEARAVGPDVVLTGRVPTLRLPPPPTRADR